MKDSEVVTLDVGGKIFKTLRSTLESAGRETYFYKLFNSEMSRKVVDGDGNIFLDHNPENFSLILDYLRGYDILKGKTQIEMTSLYRDADFFGLTDLMEKIEQLPDEYVNSSTFRGGLKRKLKHGFCLKVCSDGFYEGDFVNGIRHGHGTLLNINGLYIGEFKNNKIHGRGKLTKKNGDKFEGVFEKDQYKNGRLEYPDGGFYEGEFLNDKLHGKGKFVWSDGWSYEGDWENGDGHVKGKFDTLDYISEGDFKYGVLHGRGKRVYKDGRIEEGVFENDKLKRTRTN